MADLYYEDKELTKLRITQSLAFPGSMLTQFSLQKKKQLNYFNTFLKNKQDYLACIKSDGVRYLLIEDNRGLFYLFNRKCEFFLVNTQINNSKRGVYRGGSIGSTMCKLVQQQKREGADFKTAGRLISM